MRAARKEKMLPSEWWERKATSWRTCGAATSRMEQMSAPCARLYRAVRGAYPLSNDPEMREERKILSVSEAG